MKKLGRKCVGWKTLGGAALLNAAFFATLLLLQWTEMHAASAAVIVIWLGVDIVFLIYLGLVDFWRELDRTGGTKWLIAGGIWLTGLFLFLIWWLTTEDMIQQYDSVVYWEKAVTYARDMPRDFIGCMQTLIASLSEEYTNVAAVPIAALLCFFGNSFTIYCLCVFAAYYIPSAFIMAVCAVRLWAEMRARRPKIGETVICFVVFSASAAFLQPVLQGYLDVVGVALAGLLLNVSLHWRWQHVTFKKDLYLMFMSVLLLLSRRWYAFYIVGFYFCIGLSFLIQCCRTHKWDGKAFRGLALNLLMIAGASCALLLLVAPRLFATFLGANYGAAYSAYRTMPFYEDLWQTIQVQGGWIVLAAIAGVAAMWKTGAWQRIVELGGPAAVAATLFFRVQSMGLHHRYLVTPTILVFACVGVLFLMEWAARRWKMLGNCTTAAVLILSIGNLAIAFSPLAANTPASFSALTSIRSAPPKMASASALRQIAADLRTLTEGTGKTVYVCGDGSEFSQELLRKSLMPEETEAIPSLLANSIVDLRDGFPDTAFLADYIVLQDPFSTEFEEVQEVSAAVWDMVTQDEKQYRLLASYDLNDAGLQALIYEKISPTNWQMVQQVYDRLIAKYPEEKELFAPNWFIALETVENARAVNYLYETQNEIRKKAGEQLTVSWQLDGHFEHLSFTIVSWVQNIEMQIWTDGEQLDSYILTGEGAEDFSFSVQDVQQMQLIFSGGDLNDAVLTFLSPYLSEIQK